MKNSEIKTSIRNFGFVFIGIGILGLYSFYLQYSTNVHPEAISYIVIFVFLLKLVIGILIVFPTKLGLYYFLFALNIIYLGYSIGTQISNKYSKYVRQYLQERKS